MKPLHALVPVSLGFVVSGAALFLACGGSGDTIPVDVDGGSVDGTAADSGGNATDAAASDSGPVDSGSDAPTRGDGGVPEGGRPSDPGVVACGVATTCSPTPGEFCCVDVDGGFIGCGPGPSLSFCMGKFQEHCDESADCDAGVPECCVSFGGPVDPPGTACRTSCAGGVQVCKTSAECKNGMPCVVQTCRGQLLETCGAIPPAFCL